MLKWSLIIKMSAAVFGCLIISSTACENWILGWTDYKILIMLHLILYTTVFTGGRGRDWDWKKSQRKETGSQCAEGESQTGKGQMGMTGHGDWDWMWESVEARTQYRETRLAVQGKWDWARVGKWETGMSQGKAGGGQEKRVKFGRNRQKSW